MVVLRVRPSNRSDAALLAGFNVSHGYRIDDPNVPQAKGVLG